MTNAVDDAIQAALQVVLSNVSRQSKLDALVSALKPGCDRQRIQHFLRRRRTFNDILFFVNTHRPDRAMLPLHIRNHIRHLMHNPLLQNHPHPLSVEILHSEVWMMQLPDMLQYVIRRINADISMFQWVLFNREKARQMEDVYREHAQTITFWKNAFVIGYEYLGMGHVQVIAYDAKHDVFFKFREGGSNGYDREYNFRKVICLTYDSIQEASWKELMME